MKFAVIGNGSMGNRRIRHALQLTKGEVVGYDIRDDRRAEVSERHGIRTVGSVEALIAEKPDAVFICVPPSEHKSYMALAITQGWHFMTEQPALHTLEGAEDIIAGVKRHELITHVSCNKRFHPGIQAMKQLIEAGRIGPVLTGMVEIGEWLPDWHPYEPYTDYYPARKAKGGGLDAICELEWLNHLFGQVERIVCFAGHRTSLDIDTDDVAQFLLAYEQGPQIFLHTDMVQRTYAHYAKFIGELGTLEWDWANHKVHLYEASTEQWQEFEEEADLRDWPTMEAKPGWQWVEPMYMEDARAFLDRVNSGDTSTERLQEGIEEVRLVLGALDAGTQHLMWSPKLLNKSTVGLETS
jgi:predicted dehydrogenase